MVADFFTKPLQGSLFQKFYDWILNKSAQNELLVFGLQECVGARNSALSEEAGTDRQTSSTDRRTYAEVAKAALNKSQLLSKAK